MAKKQKDDQFDAGNDENAFVEVKVSSDDGETWFRRKINMGVELDESGLQPGELFQLQGKQYKIVLGEEGMRVELLDKPTSRKQAVIRR